MASITESRPSPLTNYFMNSSPRTRVAGLAVWSSRLRLTSLQVRSLSIVPGQQSIFLLSLMYYFHLHMIDF